MFLVLSERQIAIGHCMCARADSTAACFACEILVCLVLSCDRFLFFIFRFSFLNYYIIAIFIYFC